MGLLKVTSCRKRLRREAVGMHTKKGGTLTIRATKSPFSRARYEVLFDLNDERVLELQGTANEVRQSLIGSEGIDGVGILLKEVSRAVKDPAGSLTERFSSLELLSLRLLSESPKTLGEMSRTLRMEKQEIGDALLNLYRTGIVSRDRDRYLLTRDGEKLIGVLRWEGMVV
ncbi:hypothetical protein GF318_06320 [Candidatus Micrarchaeota archaeon]|nr:hypothetical protein [Candidatus Micrarchaeota archaeon]